MPTFLNVWKQNSKVDCFRLMKIFCSDKFQMFHFDLGYLSCFEMKNRKKCSKNIETRYLFKNQNYFLVFFKTKFQQNLSDMTHTIWFCWNRILQQKTVLMKISKLALCAILMGLLTSMSIHLRAGFVPLALGKCQYVTSSRESESLCKLYACHGMWPN